MRKHHESFFHHAVRYLSFEPYHALRAKTTFFAVVSLFGEVPAFEPDNSIAALVFATLALIFSILSWIQLAVWDLPLCLAEANVVDDGCDDPLLPLVECESETETEEEEEENPPEEE